MKNVADATLRSARWLLVLGSWLLCAGSAPAQAPGASAGADLLARHAGLQRALERNAFGRPLHLASVQDAGSTSGDIHAVVDHPFATVSAALGAADPWCDILILHPNVKQCVAAGSAPDRTLVVHIGTKHAQRLTAAQRVEFDFRVPARGAEYLQVQMRADEGPFGAYDFRIRLEAVPLAADRTFMHFSYSYRYGLVARAAMQTYLATIGRSKVGFSVIGHGADGRPEYVGDVRGVVERNTMRYYLAIDSYLRTFDDRGPEQLERRLRDWFAATEHYPTQLHEIDERDYLEMKRAEIARQRAAERP